MSSDSEYFSPSVTSRRQMIATSAKLIGGLVLVRSALGDSRVWSAMPASSNGAPATSNPALIPASGYAINDPKGPFQPFQFSRRAVGPRDVQIDILYSGICHSDIHTARGEWPGAHYPCVPGHEILGRVVAVGAEVTSLRPGDLAAVGCMVDSCGHCASCSTGLEQFCDSWPTYTYGSPDKISGGFTYGGYSNRIVVTERFVVKMPEKLAVPGAAPLLCAGITTYSPLRYWRAGPGKKVGIVGIGGLGHIGVKIAAALGAEVYALTTSPDKQADARRFGARDALLSTGAAALQRHRSSFDLILSTIPRAHDLTPYTELLKRDGALVIVGSLEFESSRLRTGALIMGRRSVTGSLIGGMPETREVIDFCATHGILAEAQVIGPSQIDAAYENVVARKARYRYVIDMSRTTT